MPAHEGSDKKGPYVQWGSQKKYYYKKGDKKSKAAAWKKATAQGAAIKRSGYKGNEMLQKLRCNFSGKVRYDRMMDKDYLVAPMVMMVEGVHEGNNGPLLYLEEDMAKTPQVWNFKPVVVYHPSRNGQGVTACDPVVLSNRQVGVIMNTECVVTENGPGLRAEAWMEKDRMNKVDERIAAAVEKNEMMELSTGLFTDNEKTPGEWNGEKYDAIAHNFRPDHLALLPDLKGACSIEDGAGFLRLNAVPEKINIIKNAMSHGNIRSLLNSWLQETNAEAWVEAVYDDFFIYLDGRKYYKYKYSLANNEITVTGDAEEVVRVTEFRTKTGDFVGNENDVNNRKESVMNKKKIIDALIKSNGNSWGEDDRETLDGLEDSVLEKMQASEKVAADAAVENAVEKYKAEEKAKVEAEAAKTETQLTANADKKPQTVEEYVANAPKEIASPLRNMIASYDAIKASLVKRLTDNEKCQFTEAQLNEKEVDELKRLVALASSGDEEDSLPDFSGQGIEPVGNVEKIEPLVAPPVMAAAAANATKN